MSNSLRDWLANAPTEVWEKFIEGLDLHAAAGWCYCPFTIKAVWCENAEEIVKASVARLIAKEKRNKLVGRSQVQTPKQPQRQAKKRSRP